MPRAAGLIDGAARGFAPITTPKLATNLDRNSETTSERRNLKWGYYLRPGCFGLMAFPLFGRSDLPGLLGSK